jgi:glutathione synthase/RimK-type ligase-like ATP-grasp enzyme
MEIDKYSAERLLSNVVKRYCQTNGIKFEAFSDDWIIKLHTKNGYKYIIGFCLDINNGAAQEVAKDKVATYQVLNNANIPAVPHHLLRAISGKVLSIENLEQTYSGTKKILLKPLRGESGQEIYACQSVNDALEIALKEPTNAWALSPQLELVNEYRCLVLNDEPILIYRKSDPSTQKNVRYFNLSKGAKANKLYEDDPLYEQLSAISISSAKTIGLKCLSVDVVQLTNGELRVLEVNGSASLEQYAKQSDEHKETAIQAYTQILKAMLV